MGFHTMLQQQGQPGSFCRLWSFEGLLTMKTGVLTLAPVMLIFK